MSQHHAPPPHPPVTMPLGVMHMFAALPSSSFKGRQCVQTQQNQPAGSLSRKELDLA